MQPSPPQEIVLGKGKVREGQSRLSRALQRRRGNKRRHKALRTHMARERRHMAIVDRKIDNTRAILVQQYGVAADPDLLLWQNVEVQLKTMDMTEVRSRPRNMACHNLLQRLELPSGSKELLGLNLNYCVKPPSIAHMTKMTFTRLQNDLRRMWGL